VEVDAQIKHSSRKLQNSQKIQEQVGNDAERQQAKLHSLRRDLFKLDRLQMRLQVTHLMLLYSCVSHTLFTKADRRAAQHNTSLSENSLAEYRSLSHGCQRVFCRVNVANRKASVCVLAVSERQTLETLSRDGKTASRTLTQVRAKDEESKRNKERLRADEQTQKASKSEVPFLEFNVSHLLTVFSKLEESLLTSRATMRAQSKITKTSRVSGQGQGISVSSMYFSRAISLGVASDQYM
jgi:structural maintenance of chromosome 1